MRDTGDLIESLEADVARLQAELARLKEREAEREAERVKRAFVEGAVYQGGRHMPEHPFMEAILIEARRRLAEDKL